jgi:D-alanyl-D-alanine dipeptidase
VHKSDERRTPRGSARRRAPVALLLLLPLVGGCSARWRPLPHHRPEEYGLVDIATIDPTIRLDMRYATANNFTGHKLYPVARCLLREEVARRLAYAQKTLQFLGMGLEVYDCYRPLSVQKEMWKLVPDERYVADPAKGSRHNRGAAVDVTLVWRNGSPIRMPTDFDDFSDKAHRDYNQLPPDVIANRKVLENIMVEAGFWPLPTEWWHFDAPDWQRFPVLDVPIEDFVTGDPVSR